MSFNTHWKEIIGTFDFNQVHKVMIFLNWRWYINENEYSVPTVGQIMESAREMCERACDEQIIISSGGLKASYYPDEDYLSLEFILESSDNYALS